MLDFEYFSLFSDNLRDTKFVYLHAINLKLVAYVS